MMTRKDGDNAVDKKALQINLDATKYGTFAEIGAGQEVARQFFHVGGASGTIAKTISAYDMTFSDAIYGPTPRYVSRQRLYQMLEYEYKLLIERLAEKRGGAPVFSLLQTPSPPRATTTLPRATAGWASASRRTRAPSPTRSAFTSGCWTRKNVQQQDALGIIGVNLIHSAFYQYQNPDSFIGSLLDGLTVERVQVDIIKFSGPDFHYIDNRLMALQLVEQGLSDAAMFTPDGEVVRPDELLYKKDGARRTRQLPPAHQHHPGHFSTARKHAFLQEPKVMGEEAVVLMEITMQNLAAWGGTSGKIDHMDFLERADVLGKLGYTVLISKFGEYFRLGPTCRVARTK